MRGRLAKRAHSIPGDPCRGPAGAALLAALWLVASDAQADSASLFSLSGFGTLGAVHSSENRADFTSSYLKPNGAGFSHGWSTDVDSLIAGQLTVQPSSQFSAVVQVVSEQLYDGTYRPHIEWANLKYEPTPDVTVRLGRTVLPSFMFSDTRKVGYANPWVRPPVEVYSLVPISNSDGIDASYRLHLGEWVQTLTGTYGKSDPRLPSSVGGSAHGRDMWLLSDTIEYAAFSVHLAYQHVVLTVPALNALFEALRDFGPQGAALANRYEQVDKGARFIGVGAQYNPGSWFLMGEWGNTDYHSVLGESTAWYASTGYRWSRYRWAEVTPYLTYSEARANSNTSDPGLSVMGLPPALMEPVLALNAGLNTLLSAIAVQKTVGVGARWDLIRNAALKIQYDRSRLGGGSHGTLINVQPGFKPGGTVNLFTATIDFVW
jgi:hypothetical protein